MTLLLKPNDDNDGIVVENEIMMISELIRTIVNTYDEEEEIEIPLLNVNKKMLAYIVEFCRHHVIYKMKTIPRPLPSADLAEVLDEWYLNYIHTIKENNDLYGLLMAVHYMDIVPLQELVSACIASMIRGKNPAEIKEILGI